MSEIGVYIGKYVVPRDREYYEVKNPANFGQVISKFPRLKRNDVADAIKVAKETFEKWREYTAYDRAKILFKLADILEQRMESIAKTLTLEEGKTLPESKYEVERVSILARFYGSLILNSLGKTIPSSMKDSFHITMREPLGVVGVITPWNFPFLIPGWKIIPAIATGNTVVFKPATNTPTVAYELVKAFYDAGLPDGVLNFVTGSGGEVGDEIVANKDISAISFTGSLQVGKEINARIGNRFVRVQLELGGKNPTVLTKNGNFNLAIEHVTRSVIRNAGQVCLATSRFLVPKEMHDKAINALVEKFKSVVIGNGLRQGVQMGPLSSREQFEKVLGYIEIGKGEGAKLVYGGEPIRGSDEYDYGYFVKPTIFDDVTKDMRIAREEIFGPVLAVMVYDSLDEAIEIVNSTDYGLVSEIVSNDIGEIMRFANKVESGVIKVNRPTSELDQWVPYGGFKGSGNDIYKELGEDAINFYTRIKAIYVNY
ncbi:MAG: aldehyde dehydrogenase [Candidatus Aramenus sulfurataquae]|jgi:aldehyde dehydrogenase (NAD+)|uniref:Aldehyde dehydrogenase n=2 Tax=Candidatus Aramenus sulfurataquae TaxID=1326980 RepID=W7KJX7_9CREN|nr:MAG: aldehyde dehydrogenase [Candidatus Aramenus sulfurataquae]